MPGMNSGLNSNNPTVVAAFRSALLHQGLIVLVVFAVLALAWIIIHEWLRPPGAPAAPGAGTAAEPGWRQLLRIGFGVIWIFDGLLQAQPSMAVGLPSQVIQPAAASSPGWVQHIVNWAGTSWSYHPIQAGAAAVWIQIGLGVWLITASRGPWSRLAGLASAGWALVVWVFGEAFGGIFAPGLTWLFGAPGAAVFYLAAGLLIAAPQRSWRTPQLGRTALGGLGVFFIGMASPAGLARPRLLAGHAARWQRHAGRHGQIHDGHPATGTVRRLGPELRVVHRGARLRGEPVRGDRAGGDRRRPADRGERAAGGTPGDRHRDGGALPGGLGAGRGLRLLRRAGHRSQQHDPAGPAGGGRLPGADPGPGSGDRPGDGPGGCGNHG